MVERKLIVRGLTVAALLTFVLFVMLFAEVIYAYGAMYWALLGFIGLMGLVFEFRTPKGGRKFVGIMFAVSAGFALAAFIASCVSAARPGASGIGLGAKPVFTLFAVFVFGMLVYVNIVPLRKDDEQELAISSSKMEEGSAGEAGVNSSGSCMNKCSVCCWGFFSFVVALASVHAMIVTKNQVKFFPGEDKLIEIDGHKMFARCMGEEVPGKLPVLFAHGLGGNSLDFSWIQRNISQYTRTCSFDRAGYGQSRERGRLPRYSGQIAVEMAELAEKVGFTNGYIVTGHSFAGFNLRMLQSLYPERVKGMVLVDPVIETATENCDASAKNFDGLYEFGARIVSSGVLDVALATPAINGFVNLTLLPEDVQGEYFSNLLRPGYFRTRADEWTVWGQSCESVDKIANKTLDMPFHLIIPTNGIHIKDLQKPRDLVNLSPQSTYIEITDEEADHVSVLHNENYAQITITSLLTILNEL